MRIARHRAWVIVGAGLLSLLLSLCITSAGELHQPTVEDEFSYLLEADTFAHGRLTNPTPAMWPHFESFHIILTPSYQSKYPPGQGLFLALGQVLSGQPIVGAWISIALACAAITWMLYAVLPGRWVLVGSVIALVHPMVLFWGQIYWGGGVALLGGALLIGATMRLASPAWRPHALRNAILLGIGLLILGNSRPFEGAIVGAVMLVVLGARFVRLDRPARRIAAQRVVLPIIILLALGLAWMGWYNDRVTGSPWRLPYIEHDAQYAVAPPFLWLPAHPVPQYRHAVMAYWYEHVQYGWYQHGRSLAHFGPMALGKLAQLQSLVYAIGRLNEILIDWLHMRPHTDPIAWAALLCVPAVVGALITRRRRQRFWAVVAIIAIAVLVVGLLSEIIVWDHYAAPALPLLFVLLACGLAYIGRWRPRGLIVGPILVGLFLAWTVVPGAAYVADRMTHPRSRFAYYRADIINQFRDLPGRHLMIVRYLPGHVADAEWVYNTADIDSQKVIWARDMGRDQNRQLLAHYPDRTAWILAEDGWFYLIDRSPGPAALWRIPAAFAPGSQDVPRYPLAARDGPRPSRYGTGPVDMTRAVNPPSIWHAATPLH